MHPQTQGNTDPVEKIKKVPRHLSPIPIRKKYVPRGMDILYEDRDLVVIFKHSGLLSVKAHYEQDVTAHELLANYVRKGNSKSRLELFVVHRLDRETSGVMIFAKSYEVREKLTAQWPDVRKIYLAMVWGQIQQPSGIIESYLAEDENYKMYSVKDPEKGVLAITRYKVLSLSDKHSLLEIDLVTGKKNQIRVHLSEMGYPIVGDGKYGKRYGETMALHARSISFAHPVTGEPMFFEARVPAHMTAEFRRPRRDVVETVQGDSRNMDDLGNTHAKGEARKHSGPRGDSRKHSRNSGKYSGDSRKHSGESRRHPKASNRP